MVYDSSLPSLCLNIVHPYIEESTLRSIYVLRAEAATQLRAFYLPRLGVLECQRNGRQRLIGMGMEPI